MLDHNAAVFHKSPSTGTRPEIGDNDRKKAIVLVHFGPTILSGHLFRQQARQWQCVSGGNRSAKSSSPGKPTLNQSAVSPSAELSAEIMNFVGSYPSQQP